VNNKVWGYILLAYSVFAGILIFIVSASPNNPEEAMDLVKKVGVFAYLCDLVLLAPIYFIYKKMKSNTTETLIYQSEQ